MMMDIISCDSSGVVVAIVTGSGVLDAKELSCHIYTAKTPEQVYLHSIIQFIIDSLIKSFIQSIIQGYSGVSHFLIDITARLVLVSSFVVSFAL
jgi:hypothetical protein